MKGNFFYYIPRTLGSFKPRFEGRPEGYWEVSNLDLAIGIPLLLFIIVCMLAINVGFMAWIINTGTAQFALVWSIILLIFIGPFFFFSYYCSRNKKSI